MVHAGEAGRLRREVGSDTRCHAHHRPPPEPGWQEPRQPPALPAPGQGAGAAGRRATVRASAASRTLDAGRRGLDPGQRRARAAAAPLQSGGMRDHVLPGNKEFVEGDTHLQRPKRGGGGGGSRGRAGRRRRGRVPLRAVAARSFSICSSTTSSCPTWPSASSSAPRASAGAAPAIRSAGSPANLAVTAHHAQEHVAPHRAAPPEAGRDRGAARPRSRRSRARPTPTRTRSTELQRASCDAAAAAQPAHPLHRPGRPALPPLRGDAEAGRPGGDVLPDGRLRLDDRAHEGPGQALLRAALPLPEAPLQARRDRLHPPHPPGRGGGRGDLLLLARDRRHGGLHRAAR